METKPNFTFGDYWRLYETAGVMGVEPAKELKIGELHKKTVLGANDTISGVRYLMNCGFIEADATEVTRHYSEALQYCSALAVEQSAKIQTANPAQCLRSGRRV